MNTSHPSILAGSAAGTSQPRPQPNPWRKLSRLARGLFAATLICTGIPATPARASFCIVPTENGTWVNSNPDTRSITRAIFRMECRSRFVVKCTGAICSGHYVSEPHYYIHLYGKCHPSDCNWGEVEGRALTGSSAGWYYFEYNQGFAKRYVYVRTYTQYPGWLRVYIYNDFVDPNRADYTTDEWFRH